MCHVAYSGCVMWCIVGVSRGTVNIKGVVSASITLRQLQVLQMMGVVWEGS